MPAEEWEGDITSTVGSVNLGGVQEREKHCGVHYFMFRDSVE